MNFWHILPKPFTALAPMEAVTDYAFREIVAKYAKPNVLFTEFTSSDALLSNGYSKTIGRLAFSNIQRPIVAQVWGNNVTNLAKTAELVSNLGFDGIDINMGCPDKNVTKKGCGSALIGNKSLVTQIVTEIKKSTPQLSISIKTRLGIKNIETDEWLGFLLTLPIDTITIHLRTVKEKSVVPAHWDEMQKIISLRNKLNPKTIIIGNGDIKNLNEVKEKYLLYKMDGAMLGRGIFSNFFVFNKVQNKDTKKHLIKIMLEHTKLHSKTYGEVGNFNYMKKFYKMYVREFRGATELKNLLMDCKNYNEVYSVIKKCNYC